MNEKNIRTYYMMYKLTNQIHYLKIAIRLVKEYRNDNTKTMRLIA